MEGLIGIFHFPNFVIFWKNWDFNLSFGNANFRSAYLSEGFQLDENPVPWWWDRFMEDLSFVTDMQSRWVDVREKHFSNESILATIDSLSLLLEEAQIRNFQRWDILGNNIWPNYFVGESYGYEMAYLKRWTLDRLYWLDNNLSVRAPHEEVYSSVFPNPVSTAFRYSFDLKRPGVISLLLYDLSGRPVSQIISDVAYPAGKHSLQWQASDLESSSYILMLSIDGNMISRKKIMKL